MGTSAATSYVDSGLVPHQGYNYSVAAYDIYGSISKSCVPVRISTLSASLGRAALSGGGSVLKPDGKTKTFLFSMLNRSNRTGKRVSIGEFRYEDKGTGIALRSTSLEWLESDLKNGTACFKGTGYSSKIGSCRFFVRVMDKDFVRSPAVLADTIAITLQPYGSTFPHTCTGALCPVQNGIYSISDSSLASGNIKVYNANYR